MSAYALKSSKNSSRAHAMSSRARQDKGDLVDPLFARFRRRRRSALDIGRTHGGEESSLSEESIIRRRLVENQVGDFHGARLADCRSQHYRRIRLRHLIVGTNTRGVTTSGERTRSGLVRVIKVGEPGLQGRFTLEAVGRRGAHRSRERV